MLKATPIPDDIFQADAYLSSRILLEQATKAGLTTIKPDIAFDWEIVRQEIAGQKVAGGRREPVIRQEALQARRESHRSPFRHRAEIGWRL
jgi:hypothetical protein